MANIIENSNQQMVVLSIESKLLQQKIILISSEITEETVTEYQSQLMYLMSLCNKPDDIITLYINTPGGSVYDGLGLLDLINYAKKQNIIIRTVNIGKACSMGALLLMSGTKGYRESLLNSSVMIHEISSGGYGKIQDLEENFKETQRLQNIINSIISENSSEELIKLCSKKDLWLNTTEALKYNIIDKIL